MRLRLLECCTIGRANPVTQTAQDAVWVLKGSFRKVEHAESVCVCVRAGRIPVIRYKKICAGIKLV